MVAMTAHGCWLARVERHCVLGILHGLRGGNLRLGE